jgi:hypothetical protein
MKELRKVTTAKEVVDLKGWTITRGTILHVMKEGPPHPRDGHRVLVCRVDNGTGHLDLMPETVIRDSDLEAGWKVGDLVWTRFGSSGRQAAQVITLGSFGTVYVLRFRENSGRWTKRATKMATSQILSLYDGPPLRGQWTPRERANRYLNITRDKSKREYGWAYLAWLRNGAVGIAPDHPGLGKVEAVALRASLDQILGPELMKEA